MRASPTSVDREVARSSTPTGSRLIAQGRPRSGRLWVKESRFPSTPTGLRPTLDATPLGLELASSIAHPGCPAARATLGYEA